MAQVLTAVGHENRPALPATVVAVPPRVLAEEFPGFVGALPLTHRPRVAAAVYETCLRLIGRLRPGKGFKAPSPSEVSLARKKRKKEEDVEFKTPKFDEVAFMKKEMEGAKAALVTIGYALALGLASYVLTVLSPAWGAPLAALLGFLALYGVRYLYPAVGLDTAKFDRRTWAGNGAIFLFAWLAFWVLLLNPPFLDVSPPLIDRVQVQLPGADSWTDVSRDGLTMLALGGNTSFDVRVRVLDNIRVGQVQITVTVGTDVTGPTNMDATEQPGWFAHSVSAEGGRFYQVAIAALDHQGLRSDLGFTVQTT